MDLVAEGDEAYRALLRRLKRALDPNDILAPGRYGMG
jgi:FAD/FMN-containing dehydrogenase